MRSPAAAVAIAVLYLLGVDPLLAGISTPIAHWGLGGVSGALTGSGAADLEPAWAAGWRCSATPPSSGPGRRF